MTKREVSKFAKERGLIPAIKVIGKPVQFSTSKNTLYELQRVDGKVLVRRKPINTPIPHGWHVILCMTPITEGNEVELVGQNYHRVTHRVTKIW